MKPIYDIDVRIFKSLHSNIDEYPNSFAIETHKCRAYWNSKRMVIIGTNESILNENLNKCALKFKHSHLNSMFMKKILISGRTYYIKELYV